MFKCTFYQAPGAKGKWKTWRGRKVGHSVGMRVQSQAPQSPVQSPLSEGKHEKPLSNHKGEQQGEKSHSDQT